MTKGIVITEHGEWYEYEHATVEQIQDATKGYFEGLALYDVTGDGVGYMYMNEMGHGLINTPASALSFMFGGSANIMGNVLVAGAVLLSGEVDDINPTIKELIAFTCSHRKDLANV